MYLQCWGPNLNDPTLRPRAKATAVFGTRTKVPASCFFLLLLDPYRPRLISVRQVLRRPTASPPLLSTRGLIMHPTHAGPPLVATSPSRHVVRRRPGTCRRALDFSAGRHDVDVTCPPVNMQCPMPSHPARMPSEPVILGTCSLPLPAGLLCPQEESGKIRTSPRINNGNTDAPARAQEVSYFRSVGQQARLVSGPERKY